MHLAVNMGGIPHLAKNERDVGHPAFEWEPGAAQRRDLRFLSSVRTRILDEATAPTSAAKRNAPATGNGCVLISLEQDFLDRFGFVTLVRFVGVDLFIDSVMNIVNLLPDTCACFICLPLRFFLMTIRGYCCSIFSVAPGFPGGALYLVGYSLVGKLLVT